MVKSILVRCIAILFVAAAVISVDAQDTDTYEQAPARKSATKVLPDMPPYMVCFGDGPKWSIEFVSWGVRYIGGVNQPDQDFLGGFFWEADEKVWVWQMASGNALSAKIRKASCTEAGASQTYPYAALVYLPQGDILGGCCRKLKPGEAPVSPQNAPAIKTPTK
ncbi:MAG: hypothetical protein ABSE85_06495 [Candidatus Korobacteraceae bacterium]|jgi:uncharacterized membrane protein